MSYLFAFLQGEQSIALIGFAPAGLTQHRGTLTVGECVVRA